MSKVTDLVAKWKTRRLTWEGCDGKTYADALDECGDDLESALAEDGAAKPDRARLDKLLEYIENGRSSTMAPWREFEIREMLAILTTPAAAPVVDEAHPAVTEEMRDRALAFWNENRLDGERYGYDGKNWMMCILVAALGKGSSHV